MTNPAAESSAHDLVLVIDRGAGNSQVIARRIREARVFSEVIPGSPSAEDVLARNPKAVIIAGVDGSVENDPLAQALTAANIPFMGSAFDSRSGAEPADGRTATAGDIKELVEHFLFEVAGCRPTWTPQAIIDDQIARIRERVGNARVICGLSGGVDSAVAAAIVQRAVGDQLTCVFVNHGLLREGEPEQVERDFVAATGVRLKVVDAVDRFLGHLADVTDPETKRKIIGREFIRVFEQAEREVIAEAPEGAPVRFLVQGTLYPDVIESAVGETGVSVKSHHNVGGLPEDLEFELIEPLYYLFKDEVRQIGRELGLPDAIVDRHPFPGPGLGIRIVGAVDADRLAILRRADAIVREETTRAGLDAAIWQFPVVLLADVRSVGVNDDGRTYGHPIVLRPVTSQDAMTADWARLDHELIELISTRITTEVAGVNRVVLDITGKPPGTIEWE